MNILYDRLKKTFFHEEESIKTFGFAKNSFLLSSKDSNQCYTFTVSTRENRPAIPLIGIVSSKEGRSKYRGNFELFRSIQLDVEQAGGICFVFSPQDVIGDSIGGIMYNHVLNKWVKCLFPVPNVIYNRVPSRHAEQNQSYERLLQFIKKHKIPFFNPHFFNKWEIYELLSKNEGLKIYLPQTELVTDEASFTRFLTTHQKVYVKHSLASQGKGIRLIEIDPNGGILCKSIKKMERFVSISRLHQTYREWFTDHQWILQEAVPCKTLHDHRYDFRILVLHTGEDFRLIGIGVRMSQRQEVTTHVPTGGKIISLKEVADTKTKKEISRIVQTCGEELSKSFGYVGEFSIDLAPREQGGFVLFEINSKPMSFDEIDIEAKRRQQLVRTFLTLSAENSEG
ncbi:YheC/YheD family endospore coat-associated protein [Rossellomorea arthrocnemi]|jgi:glutathione synthase/RimK-type ligase-like ATP-grasp enzyme|uniref:YheC/YheD family endospore coat-associated protein n=1 Tax=Rossellomorea arthrocnemi TaxID=2769542 RepID=UPI00191A1B24|nr:YheC/YheD family protein [Rossellomorea arthrocnemi]